jgi:hypothetical protein
MFLTATLFLARHLSPVRKVVFPFAALFLE